VIVPLRTGIVQSGPNWAFVEKPQVRGLVEIRNDYRSPGDIAVAFGF
jgi:hypothetical protein